jgi:hypothetical protein
VSSIVWGNDTLEAAVQVFGGQVHNPSSRTFKILDRYIQHAYSVWLRRYEMNPSQAEYADVVLANAIWRARKIAEKKNLRVIPVTTREINGMVNHERVHEGFSRRSTMVDVTDLLKGAVS